MVVVGVTMALSSAVAIVVWNRERRESESE